MLLKEYYNKSDNDLSKNDLHETCKFLGYKWTSKIAIVSNRILDSDVQMYLTIYGYFWIGYNKKSDVIYLCIRI